MYYLGGLFSHSYRAVRSKTFRYIFDALLDGDILNGAYWIYLRHIRCVLFNSTLCEGRFYFMVMNKNCDVA